MKGRICRPESTTAPDFPEVGRVHIGMKNERGLPTSIDWFRPTGKYAELYAKYVGEKPSTITILFPYDDAEKVCNEEYVYRDDKGAKVAWGDGHTFNIWNGKKYVPCTVEEYPDIMDKIAAKFPTKRGADNWDITLTLRFFIPALLPYVCGLWQFTTKGRASSVLNIRDSFDSALAAFGTVTRTPFDLSVQFAKSNKPGVNSRYPVVSLVANSSRVAELQKVLAPMKNLVLMLSE